MDSLSSQFLSPIPFPHPPKTLTKPPRIVKTPAKPRRFVIFATSSDPWTLSSGHKTSKFRPRPYRRKPLSDDDARRIILAKSRYLACLRRNQGSGAQTPRWIRRTPEQMARYVEDDRDGHLYGKCVVAAIRTVRQLGSCPEGSYDMREVMGSFVAKLSFKEMCIVLKEQRGWRQARDFFGWMKLQLSYRPSVIVYTILLRIYGQVGKIKLAEQVFLEMLEAGCEPDEVACGTMLCSYARWGRNRDMMLFYSAVRRRDIAPSVAVFNFMMSSLQKQKLHGKVIMLWEQMLNAAVEANSFTFTLVIRSYIQDGHFDKALDAFEKMKHSGFKPEEATYGLLIDASSKLGKGDETLRFYEEMKTLRITPSNYTFASLLTLHYKNNDYSKAQSLFSDMERYKIIPDEVIYGIIIRIYGKVGLYEDALNTFEEIKKSGLLSDEKTYLAMAQVHLNVGNYEKALQVIQLMESGNVEMSTYTYSALLRSYVAKEDVASAEVTFQKLFKMGLPDSVCCNELLGLYNKLGLLEEAKAFILQMREEGLIFDESLYKLVLGVYCKEQMIDEAEKLLEEMKNAGVGIDKATRSSLLAMYAELGALQKAADLLETSELPDSMALSVMISKYLEDGLTEKFQGIIKSLFQTPGGLSVVCQLISKYARKGILYEAEAIYAQFSQLGFKPDDSVYASMITLYGQCKQVDRAREIFISVLDSAENLGATCNSMIDVYCKSGEIDEANQLFKEIVSLGVIPDPFTISILVNSLSKHGKYQEAEDIIFESFQGNVELDTVAYNTYIKAMLDAGKLDSAVSIYNRMVASKVPPSLRTYNTMISVYGQGGNLEKAIEIFNAAQGVGFSIDEKAYTNMISYYGKAGRTKEASVLFNKMKEDGIRPGKISYNTMINVYATSGLLHEAEKIFHDMQNDGHFPDSMTYIGMIKAFTESKKYTEAEEVITKMLEEGITPLCAHFNHLVFAFVKEGSVMDAERVYSKMNEIGLKADVTCCRTMMRAYLDFGLIDKGLSFFETVDKFLKPDGFILSAAVHLYKFAGKVSEARDVLDKITLHRLLFLSSLRVGSKAKTELNIS